MVFSWDKVKWLKITKFGSIIETKYMTLWLQDNFTFKCHRSNVPNQQFLDIYAVNDIKFHPVHGTLATVWHDDKAP